MDASEKSARLVEAASVILSAAPGGRLNTVVLNKVLFYLDLVCLRDRGEVLTGNPYIALRQGPVVAKYQERLINQLESLAIARQVDEWDGSKPIVLDSQAPSHFLDEIARTQAGLVTSFFANQSSAQASEYSHENPGWQVAWDDCRRLGKPCAIDMRVAMQQIIEDDPWMEEPVVDDDEILAAADAEDGSDW